MLHFNSHILNELVNCTIYTKYNIQLPLSPKCSQLFLFLKWPILSFEIPKGKKEKKKGFRGLGIIGTNVFLRNKGNITCFSAILKQIKLFKFDIINYLNVILYNTN